MKCLSKAGIFLILSCLCGGTQAEVLPQNTQWQTPRMLDTTKIYKALHSADMNGDGRDELLAGSGLDGQGLGIGIWSYNQTDGAWALNETITGLDYDPNDIATGDFNQDGRMDVAVSMRFYGLRVFLNQGPGQWTSLYLDSRYANNVEVADLDQDGNLDILYCPGGWGYGYDYYATIFYGNGMGQFTNGGGPQCPQPPGGCSFSLADINQDGFMDLIGVSGEWENGDSRVYFRAYLNRGSRSWSSSLVEPINDYFFTREHTAGDINEDGYVDCAGIVYTPAGEFKVAVAWGGVDANSNYTWEVQELSTFNKSLDWLKVTDLNNDHHLDIIVPGYENFNGVKVYYGNGQGNFSEPQSIADEYDHVFKTGVYSDYNGDGRNDIVFSILPAPGLGVIFSETTSSTLILWNKLGSEYEVTHSEIGPNGTVIGAVDYLTAHDGNGFKPQPNPGYYDNPTNYVDFQNLQLGQRGSIEFYYWANWVRPTDGCRDVMWYGVEGRTYSIGMHYNDWQNRMCINAWNRDQTKGMGIYFVPENTPQWTTAQPMHFKLVWDGTSDGEKAKFYIDGVQVGAYDPSSTYTFDDFAPNSRLRLGSRLLTGASSWHNWRGDDGIFDDLKIYKLPVIHYVSLSGGHVPPFTNWATAATNIQAAIDAASAGDTVLVTNGVYESGGVPASGSMSNRIAVTNSVRVCSVNGASRTVIRGQAAPGGGCGAGAVRCAYLANGAVLTGFTLTNGCTGPGNYSDRERGCGGGVWCQSTNAMVTDCLISGNKAAVFGGGCFGGIISRCRILANQSGGYGGGVNQGIIRDSLICGNTAGIGGGASGTELLLNCTIVENVATYEGGGFYYCGLVNCILYFNTAPTYPNWYPSIPGAVSYMTNCCTTPAPPWGDNIINDPRFVNATAGDYHLQSTSPCINAGTNQDWMVGAMDLESNPRIRGARVDMGAYEYQRMSIWSDMTAPIMVDSGPDSAVELGVKFKSDVAGTIAGIRFYKAAANTGIHVGNLWTSNGTLLAAATFTSETASGWQQVIFTTPVVIASNTVYVASYHANNGHYSVDANYFLEKGVDNPPLHVLMNGVFGGNGVYRYGASSVFPNQSYNAANYWVDVVFQVGTSTTLTSIVVTPANSSIWTGASQQFTAMGTYSDGSARDITSQATWTSSDTRVATINVRGLATGVSAGNTTISVSLTGVMGSTLLTVQPPPLPIHYVSLSGTHVPPFTNWYTAATNIQAAIDVAVDGETVLVTNGIYKTGGAVAPPQGLWNRVLVTNSIAVRSVNGPQVTIIQGGGASGSGAGRCAYLALLNCSLAGFTLTGGRAEAISYWRDACGGGAFVSGILSNCIVIGNSINHSELYYEYGGGVYCIYGGRVINCLITGNELIGYGGGVAHQFGDCLIENCTIVSNSASGAGGTYGGVFRNCIIYNNLGGNSSGGSITYSCVTPNPGGAGNITTDPHFVNVAGGNYHLQSTSPCINAGTNQDWMIGATDLDGLARIRGARVDMGAYEYQRMSIWSDTTAPLMVDSGPDSAVELGVKFKSDVAGTIAGIRFYKAAANTGIHVGNLWASNGTLLATATFTSETASGWQQALFATPVAIASNTVYVASYHANNGHYSVDANYFLEKGVDNPPLHVLMNGVFGGNGVYRYGASSVFPNQSYNAANYWVDVVFQAGTSTTLTSIVVTPANSSILTGASQQFTAMGTYSDGSARDITSQARWTSSDTRVATINARGLATGVSAGNTTISASLAGVMGSTLLTVQPPPLPIHYVSLSGAHVPPFTNWYTAATNIQAAIDVAVDGETVLVTNGIYKTGGAVAPPQGLWNRVLVTNSIAVRSVNGPQVTIIQGGGASGSGAGRCAYLALLNCSLAGFTLTGGRAEAISYWRDACGGGAFVSGILSNCIVIGNSINHSELYYEYGGGVYCIYGGRVINCLITGNELIGYGGGIAHQFGDCLVENCTIVSNSASGGGGTYGGVFRNCIIYNNLGGNSSGGSITYSCVTPNPGGAGNITTDPHFVNVAGRDYHLQSTSPCINAGTNQDWMVGATDLDGLARVRGTRVDMGAYEYQRMSIWSDTTAPLLVDSGPDSAVELGVKFKSDVAGTIAGIRFYKAVANTGTHIGNLWTSNGTLLATATFTSETASGWQQALFATPVTIASNTVYVASYHANNGHYSVDANYFSGKGVDNPPLHGLMNDVFGGNGVYRYGASSVFPNQSYNAANYWVDVVFQAGLPQLPLVQTSNALMAVGASSHEAATSAADGNVERWPWVWASGDFSEECGASNLIDGDTNTMWIGNVGGEPWRVILDLGVVTDVTGIQVMFQDIVWTNKEIIGSRDSEVWFDYLAETNEWVPLRYLYVNFWGDEHGTQPPAIREIIWRDK